MLDYYQSRGGNADGIPVTLLSLNIYPVGGEAQTNRIISYAGLKQVAIDDATKATSGLQQLDYDLFPLAVILNGVEGSPSHKLWEIVHMDEDFGTSRVNSFRTKVDGIRAPANDPPVVNTFSVDPVFEGEKGMLNWSVTGATILEVDHGIGRVTGSSLQVGPSEETTYTLTATNNNGSTKASTTLRLFPVSATSEYSRTGKLTGTEIFSFVKKWKFMHPSDGVDPAEVDLDFYQTWMLPEGSDYDGPAFTSEGQGILGYGRITPKPGTDIQGVITNVGLPEEGKRRTAYFRKTFTLDRAQAQVGFEMLCVDGAVVYLDGKEIARRNFMLPDAYTSLAQGALTYPSSLAYYGTDVLGKGEHTLAVSLHQDATTSSTMGFDLRLISRDPDRLAIATFNAARPTLVAGASTDLQWDVAGKDVALSIEPGVGEVTGGSVAVTPAQDTTYTLTAKAGGRTATQTVTVKVEPFSAGELDPGTKGLSIRFEDSPIGAYTHTRKDGSDLGWTATRTGQLAMVTSRCTDPDDGSNKKQFHLNNGSFEFVSEPIRVKGYTNILVSLDVHAQDQNNGFEISDRIELIARHSDDGLSFADTILATLRGSRDGNRATALDFGQPWSEATGGLDIVTGEDGKLLTVASTAGQVPDSAQVLRVVVRAVNNSEHEHFYFDNVQITGTGSGGAQAYLDWWADRGADQLDDAQKTADADPDGDGVNNVAEYLFGGHPSTADAKAAIPAAGISDGKYTLAFYRVKPRVDGTNTYFVEYVTDLASGTWSTDGLILKSSLEGVEQTGLPDGKDFSGSLYEKMEATVPADKVGADGVLFLRIRVERTQ